MGSVHTGDSPQRKKRKGHRGGSARCTSKSNASDQPSNQSLEPRKIPARRPSAFLTRLPAVSFLLHFLTDRVGKISQVQHGSTNASTRCIYLFVMKLGEIGFNAINDGLKLTISVHRGLIGKTFGYENCVI